VVVRPTGGLRVIGLISGTSIDGIDVAAAELSIAGDEVRLVPLGHLELEYPDRLRAASPSSTPAWARRSPKPR
jgi:anhydro-N-acetylmuramic acid kinase